MRITISTKVSTPAELAKALRSAAAKLTVDEVVPGADLNVGGIRVQVAEQQEAPIRAWARSQGIEVGSRGRFSAELQQKFADFQKAERRAAREARAARKSAAEAVSA